MPLPVQDRSLWDAAAIERADELLQAALVRSRPGPLQVEAAISAVHRRASSAKTTDWHEIAALYAMLESFRATPAVRVNRAFAVARSTGPRAGLALLDHDAPPGTSSYPYVHLVRAALLTELGEHSEAHHSLVQALAHARNAAERAQLEEKLREVEAALGSA